MVTIAASETPGSPDLVVGEQWVAWTEGTLVESDPEIHLHDPRSGETRTFAADGAWLLGFDGDELWLLRDDSVLRVAADAGTEPSVFVTQPGLRWAYVGEGTLVWTVGLDDLHPEAETLYASRTDELDVIRIVEHRDDDCEEDMGVDPKWTVPCSSISWGRPLPKRNAVIWTEPDQSIVQVSLDDPTTRTILRPSPPDYPS